ncbi:MAG TPA: sulfur carrier protein ThiS [Paracoccus sp.]|nr:sulfur carrier protein ThiS [Paracoccus sp. (in: a-proteobacteria)]
MRIEVNGESRNVTATTVAGALEELGLSSARVATARNGAFLPQAARATTALQEGDRLEVLSAMQGG